MKLKTQMFVYLGMYMILVVFAIFLINYTLIRQDMKRIAEMDTTIALAAADYDLKKQYDFKTIRIEKLYGPGLPPVPCESGKIQQVILNILRNGAQAMQADDPGKDHRFTLRLTYEKKAGMVRFEIEDNGPGMDVETKKRVFEPFFTTKPVGVGTGLGLSVFYFIITENHAGSLDVEAYPGKGANFIIRLPCPVGEGGCRLYKILPAPPRGRPFESNGLIVHSPFWGSLFRNRLPLDFHRLLQRQQFSFLFPYFSGG
ncbi:MAG: ATP-binding protein [Thermodesulfobacteriota bacterium]|nr:ATP-binding protein [Thermodesulfobacteriota bacterium]